jgi:uncharacterized protein
MSDSTSAKTRDPLDPRPEVVDVDGNLAVRGGRCTEGHVSVMPRQRCSHCGQRLEPTQLSPIGTVWSSTVVRIAIPSREPPFGLAYVDLDDGGRLVAHVRQEAGADLAPLLVGTRVEVVGTTTSGDVEVAPC